MKVRLDILREYVFDVLLEGRVEDAQEKYPDMSDEDFDFLVHNQPAGSNNKYLMWSCKQVDEGYSTEVVVQAVRLFNGNIQRLEKKDINQYKEPGEIEEAIQKLGGASKSQQAKKAKSDTDVIYQDERFLVLRPHTAEASCKYGAGTKWCIAATASHNYFSSYSTSNNKFYFIIDKAAQPSDANAKLAIVIQDPVTEESQSRIQVFNTPDHQVGLKTAINHVGDKWPAIWEKIQEHVAANPTTREVEDAKKAVAEHIRALLAGEPVSKQGLQKIAADGELTGPVVKAIIKTFENHQPVPGSSFYSDDRYNIRASFVNRINTMTPDAAIAAVKWVMTLPTDEYYLEQMISKANLSPHDFYELLNSPKANEATLGYIVSNPHAPTALKDKITASVKDIKDTNVKRKIYTRLIKDGSITPEEMHVAMSEKIHLGDTILYKPELAQNLSPELLRMIPVAGPDHFKRLAAIPNVPPDYIVEKLADTWDKFSKYDLIEVLKNLTLPTHLLEDLWARKKDKHVRLALLQNPAIGAENAAAAAASKNSAYRFAAAHNPTTPSESLDALAADESVSTRSAVAANPKTRPETLSALARDEGTAVRASVASNAATPQNILRALRKDSDDFVRKAANKTLKSLTATEAVVRGMLSMQHILVEKIDVSDEDYGDPMSPDWRDIPVDSIKIPEWVAIFLLQNNGHATREELADAFQDWRGRPGTHDLWSIDRYSSELHRGTSAGGKGWFWSPPGITKGSLFRLTPAGAAAAQSKLAKLQGVDDVAKKNKQVSYNTARKGRTYYTTTPTDHALDVTGYEKGYVTEVQVKADDKGNPILGSDGKPARLSQNRYYRGPLTVVHEYIPMKENGHPDLNKAQVIGKLPKVSVPANAKVEFIKTWHQPSIMKEKYAHWSSMALVKYNDRSVIVSFPLWTAPHGAEPKVPPPGRRPMPPVRTSPPPEELVPRRAGEAPPAPRAPSTPRGPKTTYKIYGRHRGHPAHARLKGQAYVAPADTRFKSGEQTQIYTDDTGGHQQLRVKKTDGSDYSQLWEPSEG